MENITKEDLLKLFSETLETWGQCDSGIEWDSLELCAERVLELFNKTT